MRWDKTYDTRESEYTLKYITQYHPIKHLRL